jgi:hypothetical protein
MSFRTLKAPAFAIFGLLSGGSASGSGFSKVAAKRRGMMSAERDALLDNIKTELGKIHTVRAVCAKV